MSRTAVTASLAGAHGMAGASDIKRITAAAPGAWSAQPKRDGILVVIVTGRDGTVRAVNTRAGRPAPACLQLLGAFAGWPHSTIVAEAEAWTEASERIAARRGYRVTWAFDALRIHERSLSALPYSERRHQLATMLAQREEHVGIDRGWSWDRGRRRARSGQFCAGAPSSWQQLQLMEARPARQWEQLWHEYVDTGDAEGLVLCAADAPVAARRAKLKLKRRDTIDATCVARDGASCKMIWPGGEFVLASPRPAVGECWEVASMGFYETSGIPRYPRLIRKRSDLR